MGHPETQVPKMVWSYTGCTPKKRMKRFIGNGKLTFPIASKCELNGTSVYPVYANAADLEPATLNNTLDITSANDRHGDRLPASWAGTNWNTIGHDDYRGYKGHVAGTGQLR